jgi:ABC-type uncharacterized transport system substrate-binding protein
LADELVQLKVDVLVTHATPRGVSGQKTSTIPIVLTVVGDIVALGLVSSLRLPEGNITGFEWNLVQAPTVRSGFQLIPPIDLAA